MAIFQFFFQNSGCRHFGFSKFQNFNVNRRQARTSVEPAAAAAAAATAVSGSADEMDTITASDEHDVANQQIEQDSIVDQTTLYQYGEC